MLVSDFTWHFSEACPIKFDNNKTKRIVNDHLTTYSLPTHQEPNMKYTTNLHPSYDLHY